MKENGHLPMFDIYQEDGARLGAMALSEKSQDLLDEGEWVTVLYHTPQLLRDQLGGRNGSFAIRKEGERIVTDNPGGVTEYLELQSAIAAATRAT